MPELAEVESEVRARLRDLYAEEGARASVAAARDRVAAGESLDDVASDLGATVQETEPFATGGRVGELGANAEIASAALALEQGDVGEPIVTGQNIVLFQVSERNHFDPADFAANQDATRSQLESTKLNQLLASLMSERRQELDVSYDPNLMANLGLDQPVGPVG